MRSLISGFITAFATITVHVATCQSVLSQPDKKKPHIEIEGQFLAAKNFPAYSINENAILIEHQDLSCCYSDATFLRKLDVFKMKVIESWMLYPSEDSVWTTKIDKEKVIKELDLLVDTKAYQSMIEIDNEHFYVQRELTSEWSKLGFWMPQLKAREVSLRLPQLTLPSYCCADGLPCKANFNRYRLWIDLTNKLVLLAYGSTSDTNGCDVGPQYFVKKFH